MAVITAEPLAMPVTRPVDDTVAIEASEDVQVAVLVTSWVPPDTVAVAANCEVAPTAGAVPVTAIADTELADVGELPRLRTNQA